jgi:hypothetical protein
MTACGIAWDADSNFELVITNTGSAPVMLLTCDGCWPQVHPNHPVTIAKLQPGQSTKPLVVSSTDPQVIQVAESGNSGFECLLVAPAAKYVRRKYMSSASATPCPTHPAWFDWQRGY